MQEKNPWLISKTLFMKGRQCPKMMYLHKYHRNLLSGTNSLQKNKDKRAFSFENTFRKLNFPKGMHMQEESKGNLNENLKLSKELLEKEGGQSLFEAALVYDSVFVLLDIVHKNEKGEFEVYEIKNTTKFKPEFIWDTALQYAVCKSLFGESLKSFKLVYKNKSGEFKLKEMRDLLESRLDEVEIVRKDLIRILALSNIPDIQVGKQCDTPYSCRFKEYCKTHKI
jgi:hypothetical protein